MDAATIASIVELRTNGLSLSATAEQLGVGRRSVAKHQPKQQDKRRTTQHRHEHQTVVDVDEYADVVPIPFYPDDLPVLDFSDSGFEWRRDELNEATKTAKEWLFGGKNSR